MKNQKIQNEHISVRGKESLIVHFDRMVCDEELYGIFRHLLYRISKGENPFDPKVAPEDPRRHYLSPNECKRIFDYFSELYPEIVKVMTKIMTDWEKKKKVKPGAYYGRDIMCGCPFPFDCKKFPCEYLACSADELDNGHPFRRS